MPAYRLEGTWFPKPGISIQWRNLDRFNKSHHMAYGSGDFMEFGSNFMEIDPQMAECAHFRFDPARALATALLPGYVADIYARVFRLFGDRADPTLEWRVHRRLLSAMSWLPDSQMNVEQYQRAMIRSLSQE